MEFNEIPDDIWIDIFESVDDPAQLAVLVRTCRRFRDLASKPLLRELRWGKMESTARNLGAWKGVYQDVVALPRKLTLSIAFDFSARSYWSTFTDEMRIHDMIYSRMASFSSLHEVLLDGTAISPYTYTVLAALPNLRSLSIINCSFVRLHTSFKNYNPSWPRPESNTPPPTFPFANLPITHLSLHKVIVQAENDYNPFHPLHIITAENLTSLSITWTGGLAITYALKKWQLPKLAQLDVVMPLLTRDLVDSLVNFVQNCPIGPRIHLCIERHNLSDQQISAVQFPLKGVWSYKGPLPIASFSVPRHRIRDGSEATLTHLVMNEPLDLGGLLDGLEKLPKFLEALEIQVRKWDIELLFAIRELFPDICSLTVRYGKGSFPVDFFVTLGADILFDLPQLHTLKLLHDKSCAVSNRQLGNFHHFGGHPVTLSNIILFEDEAPECELPPVVTAILEQEDLKDYLIGWNRYCKRLRHVQLNTSQWWERKFEGDRWVEASSLAA